MGIGLGAEWSAGIGAGGRDLAGATSREGHRISCNPGGPSATRFAAVLAALVLPTFGWRWLFARRNTPRAVAFWVRRDIEEPEIWKRAHREPREACGASSPNSSAAAAARALIVTCVRSLVLFAYWGLFTWIPAYLASPVERGGQGSASSNRSAGWRPYRSAPSSATSTCGFIADRFGRRPAFLLFTLRRGRTGTVLRAAAHPPACCWLLGPLIGFFGHGYFSIFGAMLSEMFPSAIRGTAQGLCYNFGRGVSALAPIAIGAIADRVESPQAWRSPPHSSLPEDCWFCCCPKRKETNSVKYIDHELRHGRDCPRPSPTARRNR